MKKRNLKNRKVNSCWNKIGIQGDGSCIRLEKTIHCRNCPVYSEAGLMLLEREQPGEYLEMWKNHLSLEKEKLVSDNRSVIIFRIMNEWFAVSTLLFREITEVGVIHSIPHRSNKILRGMVNVYGKLQLCVSLENLLDLEKEDVALEDKKRKVYKRLIVLEWKGEIWVFEVDEVLGIHRITPEEIENVPETVIKGRDTYTNIIFNSEGKFIGCLDHELIFNSIKRRVF